MGQLVIGVGQVVLNLRFAETLKDRRKVVQSLIQKLKNEGYSATDVGPDNQPKSAILGFSMAGPSRPWVDSQMEKAKQIFQGDFEILEAQTDVFEYEGPDDIEDPENPDEPEFSFLKFRRND